MVEKKKTTDRLHQVEVTQPQQGMHTDTSMHSQPPGTYRFALNAINESKDGNLGFIVNERGNTDCFDILKEYTVVGSVYLSDDEIIVFLAPINPALPVTTTGIIGKITNGCTYEDILISDCLNFDARHPIEASHRVRNGCENVIYFTDNHNPIREININSLDQYLNPGEEYSNSDETIWDCAQFKLIPDYTVPIVDFVQIHDTGGSDMLLGTYQLALQYMDTDLNPTNWMAITQPVPISADPYGPVDNETHIEKISGGFNDIEHLPTTKSIEYTISNIDTSFEYLRIAMIRTVSGNGAPSDAYVVDNLPIEGSTMGYRLRGKIEDSTPVDINELVIPRVPYDTAKTLEQIDQRLVLGNLTSPYIDHEAFQRAANDIQTSYYTKASISEDIGNPTAPPSGQNYFDNRTYMRDEVYALGIVWILKDGTESPVYHIPGRKKNTEKDGTTPMPTGDPNNPSEANYETGMTVPAAASGYTETHRKPASVGWDSDVLSTNFINPNTPGTEGANGLHLNTEDPERWQIYNTALRTVIAWDGNTLETTGQLAYWESQDYKYPPTLGCNGTPVYPYTGTGEGGDPFVMQNLRHHKMPDTTLEPHFYASDDLNDINDGACYTGLNNLIHALGGTYYPCMANLGVEFDNIECPVSMQDSIQGYKIVRAERGEKDKSVIDKGLIYYNFLRVAGVDVGGHDSSGTDGVACDECTYYVQTQTFNKYNPQKYYNTSSAGLGDYDATQLVPIGPTGPWTGECAGECVEDPNDPGEYVPGEFGNGFKGHDDCFMCNSGAHRCSPGAIVENNTGFDWLCGDATPPTDPADPNRNCWNGGLPHFTDTAHLLSDYGVTVSNVDYYDNWGHLSYHGFKSKVDGAKEANQLFDHIKIEKALFGRQTARTAVEGNISVGDDCEHATTRACCELSNASYYGYCTPPTNIADALDENLGATPSLDGCAGGPHDLMEDCDFPFYNYPVEDSGGFVPGNTGRTEGLTNFDFLNSNCQETYIFQVPTTYNCDTADTAPNLYGVPPVFNNTKGTAFNPIPCDSTINTTEAHFAGDPQAWEDHKTSTCWYVALKRLNENQYGSIDDIEYIDASGFINMPDTSITVNDVIVFGGDSFIAPFDFRKTGYFGSCCKDSGSDGNLYNSPRYHRSATMIRHYVECDYNPNFRNGVDGDECKRYTPYGQAVIGWGLGKGGGDFLDGYVNIDNFVARWSHDQAVGLTPGSGNEYRFRVDCGPICTNYYSYNPDYSQQNTLKKYFPLDQAYKYIGTYDSDPDVDNCNRCYFNFATRIAYSEKSFQEERADHYRSFLANNYKDLPAETGSLTRLLTQNNKLYGTTEESSWILQTSQQTMRTDTTILYIGTGDFLSLPPQKLGDTIVGYGGSISQWATMKTEMGVFIVDERAQKIFLLGNEGLQPIANIGMRNWFENNLKLNLISQLSSMGFTFPYPDAPNTYAGVGFHATYDTRHARYILTKRDYEFNAAGKALVQTWLDGGPGARIELVDTYPNFYWQFVPADPLAPSVKLGLPELQANYMIDKSWTISYSGLNNRWVSFHSYRPTVYITGKNDFYSIWKNDTDDNTVVYIHNTIPYHVFYGEEYPHVLELINVRNPLQTMIYDNYHFLTETTEYNGTKLQNFDIREITFNKAMLYNEYQCTNILDLVNKNRDQTLMMQNSVINRTGEIVISRDERSWAFDGFRDFLQDRTVPIFSEEQADKNADPLFSAPLGSYADKVINPTAFINPLAPGTPLSPLEQQRFRDKYLAIRLFFGNFGEAGNLNDYKLVTNYIFPTTSISPR